MFDHILVPLDGSLLAECVLPHVLAFAKATGAKITLLHVLDRESTRDSMGVVEPLEWFIRKAEAEIYQQAIFKRLSNTEVPVTTVITEGRAADGIIQYARDQKVDLIAMSSHGLSGLRGWNISSVVQKVLFRAYTSLLIVPAYLLRQMDLDVFHYKKVFVGLDGSQRAEWVLPHALRLIAYHQATLLLAHVVPGPEILPYQSHGREEIEEIDRLAERKLHDAEIYINELYSRLIAGGYRVNTFIQTSENPIETLRELVDQEGIDLVILSAHGCTGCFKRLYGSVTLSFIAYGNTPMLILQDLHASTIRLSQAELASIQHAKH